MEDGLAFGGDGHADSPGHSAKYGSYTVLELSLNKVFVFNYFRYSKYLAKTKYYLYVHPNYRAMKLVAVILHGKGELNSIHDFSS